MVLSQFSGDGRIVLDDSKPEAEPHQENGLETPAKKKKQSYPVDLPLDIVLGKMPPKVKSDFMFVC